MLCCRPVTDAESIAKGGGPGGGRMTGTAMNKAVRLLDLGTISMQGGTEQYGRDEERPE
jgi:hypothetical protein